MLFTMRKTYVDRDLKPILPAPPIDSKYLCSEMWVYFKKAATPQVMAIQGGRIQKANKKSQNAKGKEHPAKNDAYHHYKEVGHCKRNCPAYLAELIKKKKQVGTAISKNNVLYLMLLRVMDYALESAARILNMVPTKKVDKTPYDLWYGKVPDLSYLKVWGRENHISQEVSGRVGELEEIQDEDTSPSEITSEIPMEVEGFEPPHEEEAPVRRSVRTHQAPKRLCLNVE
uniref:Retrotransposon protein, putative, Ty1-copia subclass n=1 Tax=Tanacetum cinerariifolium TaxID=118510 RepID=A0A6L2J6G9_TANCI|nr:retrotransposon protein, putative, Ty1-copia subclass [Tanacetum cinerariifolium]